MSSFGRRPSVFLVEIDRDGLNAPWGFRLKGGIDVEGGTPLEVIKSGIMELQPYSTDRKKALVDEIAQRIFEQIRIHGGRDLDAIVQGISNFQIPETVVELNQRAQEPPKVSHVNGHQNGPIKLEDKREWNLTPGAAVPTTPKPFRSTVESVQFQSEHPRRPSWVEMANKPLPTPNLQRSVSNVQISSGRPPIGALTNTLPRSNGAPRRPPPPSIHSALPSNGLRRSQSSQRLTLRPDDFWLKSRPSSRSTSMDNLHQSDHRISIGSAADGILHVGDRIVQIEHHNATKLAHFDAQNIIKHSGTNLKLGISRPGFSAPGAAPFSSLPAVKPSYTLPQKPHQGHAMHHQNQGFGSPPSQGGFYQPQPQIHQLILESEMDGARDQQGVVGREFHQPAHSSRPSSSLSNRSQPNAIMLDNTIHQSASFKRLMHNMAVGPESTEDQTDF
eukprot:TCALIF_04336-PB protein Name:"Protein of unknown function" AED:0.13 eAED:0.13 QI:376/0.6/0.83/1/0.6/0.83/6/156/444